MTRAIRRLRIAAGIVEFIGRVCCVAAGIAAAGVLLGDTGWRAALVSVAFFGTVGFTLTWCAREFRAVAVVHERLASILRQAGL